MQGYFFVFILSAPSNHFRIQFTTKDFGLHRMSLDESDSILTALEILCHVRWEALQPHRDKAFLAFQKLQVFIGNRNSGESTPSPSPPNHSHTPPPSLRSHDPPPSPNNSNSPSPSSHNHDPPPSPNNSNSPSPSSHNHDPPSSPNNSNSPSPSSHNHDPPSSPNNSNSLSRSSSNYDPPSSSDRSDSSLFSFSNHDTVTSSNHSRPFQNNDDRLASIDNLDLLSNSSPLLPDNYEPHSNEHNSPSHHKHTLALIQALNNEEDKIKKYLSKLEIDATEGKSSWPQEDSRLVDLQIGEKQSSSNIKFRKVLSQRSLAKEYDQWELETHHTSRINYLVENLSDSKDGAGGRIKKYVNGNIDRFKNKALAQRGIQWGIRLLVFERLLGEPGLSAILCFSFYRFRCLKFTDLVCLGQRVHETDWIWNLAKKKSGWLDSCQVYYDSKVTSRTSGIPVAQNNVPSKRYSSALEPSGKRPRVGQYNVSSHSTNNSNGDALTSTASLTSPVSNEEHAHGTAQANATILETTNSHQDAEYSQTQTHEGVVANPIHTLLLQKLTSSGVKDPHADYEEPMSDADADGGEDEEVDEDFGSSTTSNATSSCTSLSTLPQGFYRGQKHLYQAENVMTTAEPRRPHHLTPAFNNEQSNCMF